MKKGYHRMPDGKIMKNSEHKKMQEKKSAKKPVKKRGGKY